MFFEPKSVAVIGASRNPKRGGHGILENVMTGFQGPIHPVNPLSDEIWGLICHPSILDIPEPVDLAIVSTHAPLVAGIVRDCAKHGASLSPPASPRPGRRGPHGLATNMLQAGMRVMALPFRA